MNFEWGKRTYIMGIINVTPDSFSGDGLHHNAEAALEQAIKFQQDGADIIDIGGESTRPGARHVDQLEERMRVIPAIRLISKHIDIPISIDTYKYEVAREAIDSGATIINDVWGLKKEPLLAKLAATNNASIILMHNQSNTRYYHLLEDIKKSLRDSCAIALESGLPEQNIIIDPGLGFSKLPSHNLDILRNLNDIKSLGYPILVGTSRKSTIGLVLDLPVDDRLEGTSATVALVIANGADIVRVHEVKEMARVAQMSDAIVRGWAET